MTTVSKSSDARYPSPELVECPYPFFDQVREEAPVRFDEATQTFQVFRHEDAMFVLRHDEIFPHQPVKDNGITFGGVPMISAVGPPEHEAMRKFAFEPFKPARLKSYAPMIGAMCDLLIDRFIGSGRCELVEDFAIPLPTLVICHLMGLPEEGPEFDFIIDRLSLRSADKPGKTDVGLGINRYQGSGIHEYIRDVVTQRYEEPGDDILSELVGIQVKRDGSLNLPYLTTICTELAAGGVVTTAQMIASAMMLLLRNPEQLAKMRSDDSLILPALEETLRAESVVQSEPRVSVADCEVGGVHIPAGSTVLVVIGSANRDPERFPQPECFDVGRPRSQLKVHFGFGYGLHTCLGAPLARLEGEISLRHLFDRLGEIRLADGKNDFAHIASTHFRALRELHLEFDAR